ncbi:aminotransferase class III-fold pyridoxal phosphate-dependent enzyme [Streptomyces poriticola]|uniref:aminotransferase class III-fold pyridoxal phosphate-dependent enzyme n=1 Tax=Streptomyces poriticola TaxID=3120506 RepID=UPI002FCE16D3
MTSVDEARTAHEGVPRRQTARDPSTRSYACALPVVPVRARGLTVDGADGRRYLDCLSGAGMLVLGHHHPVVLEAIRKVLDSGVPLQVLGGATPVEDAFVAELTRTLPPALARHARVRFCGPSRTDALETAVRLARAATGRTGIRTLEHVPCEDDDEERAAEAALAATEDRARLPAGVVVHPVRGDGGMAPAPEGWLRRLRALTADRAVPLIADESETGVGRSGAFWAVQHSGVSPDVMVLSQAIGGSLPLAVVVHRDGLETGEPTARACRVRGNQLAMAAGRATLAHVREHRLAERAAVLGSRMLRQLRELAARFGCVGEVRGRGLMIGVQMTDPEAGAGAEADAGAGTGSAPAAHGRRARELAVAVRRESLRRGLIVDVGGRHENVVRLLPPLTITEEQAAAVLDRLADAVRAVARTPAGGGAT